MSNTLPVGFILGMSHLKISLKTVLLRKVVVCISFYVVMVATYI